RDLSFPRPPPPWRLFRRKSSVRRLRARSQELLPAHSRKRPVSKTPRVSGDGNDGRAGDGHTSGSDTRHRDTAGSSWHRWVGRGKRIPVRPPQRPGEWLAAPRRPDPRARYEEYGTWYVSFFLRTNSLFPPSKRGVSGPLAHEKLMRLERVFTNG